MHKLSRRLLWCEHMLSVRIYSSALSDWKFQACCTEGDLNWGHFVPAVTLLREREAWWWQVNKGDAFWQQHLHSSPLIIPFITDECGCTDSTFLQAKWLLRCSLKLKYQNVVIWNLLGWFKHRNPSFQISGVIPVLTTSRCMWQWQQCYSPSYQLCHVRVFFFFF